MSGSCRDRCQDIRDLLAASTLHESAAVERERIERHLDGCAECRRLQHDLRADDRMLSEFVGATDGVMAEIEKKISAGIGCAAETPASARPRARRLAASGRLRLAIAAVLGACIIFGASLLDRGGGAGVVWADVLARVEEARSYICRRVEKRSGEPQQDIVEYRSAEYGLRQDIYRNGKLEAVQYIVPDQKMLYALVHRDRTYMQQELSDDQIAELRRQSNASEIVKSFREHEYNSLGRRRIDGRLAEGIEIENPPEWTSVFESGTLKLWVDLATQWPVRIELEGFAVGGAVRKTFTLHEFQWNPALTAREFEVDIPADYKLIADLGVVHADQEQTLAGLRAYAALLGGRYPSRLSLATAIAEAERELDARHDRYDEAAGRDLDALFTIRSACFFFRDLQAAGKDAAYHGDTVTARDFDRVLLRWRLDDGRYRVVYGDLRTEDVNPERLAEIE